MTNAPSQDALEGSGRELASGLAKAIFVGLSAIYAVRMAAKAQYQLTVFSLNFHQRQLRVFDSIPERSGPPIENLCGRVTFMISSGL